jgi:hypothetical protein
MPEEPKRYRRPGHRERNPGGQPQAGIQSLQPYRMSRLHTTNLLSSTKRIGTGLSFVLFPVVFVFAFAVHPGLLDPHPLGPSELILRARGAGLLQFAHALVTLNTALLVVVALHFMKLLDRSAGAWAGFLGAGLAVLGSLALAADKGALCLTMSALDEISDTEFTAMMPGLVSMFSKRGWLALLWGIMLLPVGFGIQAIALIKSKAIARWQSLLFLVGVLLIATPDGVEIINLTASVLLTIAFVPYGIRIMRSERQKGE